MASDSNLGWDVSGFLAAVRPWSSDTNCKHFFAPLLWIFVKILPSIYMETACNQMPDIAPKDELKVVSPWRILHLIAKNTVFLPDTFNCFSSIHLWPRRERKSPHLARVLRWIFSASCTWVLFYFYLYQ